MDIESKLNQLTDLMVDFVPTVDRLVQRQDKYDQTLNDLVSSHKQIISTQKKTNLAMSELRQSNMQLAGVMERLIHKIDKVDEFDARLKRLEDKIL
ncbi:MAG: hypothetical protein AAF363_15315 [Bacteroidota bacterium]